MNEPSLYQLSSVARLAFATPPSYSHFFGYYTHSPTSADKRRLLTHRTGFDGRSITARDMSEIGYFDLESGQWYNIGVTHAFNWQQGALLQWLGPDLNSKVIFNDREGNHFMSRIVDLTTRETRTIPYAVYAVHPSGDRALGVRFERHYFCRAYHYEGICDERWNVPVHPEDGILEIDLKNGGARLLLRTSDIAGLDPGEDSVGVPHWLEHIIWNPSGTRFAFFHRYGTNECFVTRVFTCNADGTNLFCLPGYWTYGYSHLAWRDDSSFAIYCKKDKPVAKVYASMVSSSNPAMSVSVRLYRSLKHFIPKDWVVRTYATSGYALFQDRESTFTLFSKGLLCEDGHPSWTRDGRYMLTDTYADDAGYRHLLLYDAQNDRVHPLGRFFSPYNNSDYRCDLHPRFGPSNQHVIIDTAHSGQRQMMVLQLDWNCV